MIKTKTFFRSGLIFVTILSVVLCSFMTGMVRHETSQGTPFQTVPPVNATLATPIGAQTPVPTPLPTVGPAGISILIEGNSLIVGSETYPIGDEFLDASGIPTGASTESLTGDFGYAAIDGIEDYKLLWITDSDRVKHYIIISITDPLFVGHDDVEDGFIHYLDKLKQAEEDIMWGVGGAAGGLVAATVAQLLLCAPTAGAACLSAIATAVIGGIGGMVKLAYHYIFDYLPQMNNLLDQFDAIETLRPKADS